MGTAATARQLILQLCSAGQPMLPVWSRWLTAWCFMTNVYKLNMLQFWYCRCILNFINRYYQKHRSSSGILFKRKMCK